MDEVLELAMMREAAGIMFDLTLASGFTRLHSHHPAHALLRRVGVPTDAPFDFNGGDVLIVGPRTAAAAERRPPPPAGTAATAVHVLDARYVAGAVSLAALRSFAGSEVAWVGPAASRATSEALMPQWRSSLASLTPHQPNDWRLALSDDGEHVDVFFEDWATMRALWDVVGGTRGDMIKRAQVCELNFAAVAICLEQFDAVVGSWYHDVVSQLLTEGALAFWPAPAGTPAETEPGVNTTGSVALRLYAELGLALTTTMVAPAAEGAAPISPPVRPNHGAFEAPWYRNGSAHCDIEWLQGSNRAASGTPISTVALRLPLAWFGSAAPSPSQATAAAAPLSVLHSPHVVATPATAATVVDPLPRR